MPDIIIQSLQKAFELIFSGNSEVYATVFRTVYVTGVGTALACTWGIPIAIILGLHNFRGKWFIKGLFNAFIGVPTVALGLLLALILSNRGELGFLHFLYTLNGIVIGQAILLTPIIVSFTSSALGAADTQIRDLAKTLGASNLRTNFAIMRETIWSTVLAVTAAFNRGFGELGIALLVGGNIFQQTRVLTTTIAVYVNLGEYDVAMAYALLLMAIVIAITLVVNLVEKLKQSELYERHSFREWILAMWR
jgi:tungstate transport system permease protein